MKIDVDKIDYVNFEGDIIISISFLEKMKLILDMKLKDKYIKLYNLKNVDVIMKGDEK